MAAPFDTPLPAVGAKPWNLNPALTEIRNRIGLTDDQVSGRLEEANLRVLAGNYVIATSADNASGAMQAAINYAASIGIRKVDLLPRDGFGTAEWTIPTTLTLPPNFELDMTRARTVHPDFPNPAFYVPFSSPGVTIRLGRHRRGGGRRAQADYPAGTYYGTSALAANSVVLSFADYTTISNGTGEETSTDWRNGIRLGNGGPGGNTGLRVGNTIEDYKHANIDMPLLAFGQRGLLIRDIRGTYSPLANTNDPPHQIYLTETPTGQRSIGTHIMSAQTWNGFGGCAWSIKGQDQITIGHLNADNCPGGLQVFNVTGSVVIDNLHVTNLFTDAGGMIEGLRAGGATSDPTLLSRKMLGQARITHRGDVTAANIRAMSLDADWTIGMVEHEYTLNEVSDSQSSIHVSGSGSDITSVRVRNYGTGGVRGINYADGTTNHLLRTSPNLYGTATGVNVADTVSNSTLTVDFQTIKTTGTYAALSYPKTTGITIRGGGGNRPYRRNRWYARPLASSLGTVTLVQNRLYAVPLDNTNPITVDASSLNVQTATAGVTVRMGYMADFGNGDPGALLAEIGSFDVSTTGIKDIVHTPITLPPNSYAVVVAQGGTVGVRAVAGPAAMTGAVDSSVAHGSAIAYNENVTGALPATFSFTNASNFGFPRVAYRIANI